MKINNFDDKINNNNNINNINNINNLNQREKLSALADGSLQEDELAQALEFSAEDEGHETWHIYHLIGDTLRSPDLASPSHQSAFLGQLRHQLAQEPAPVWAPPPPPQAANDSVFRWKMVAGLATLAAVITVSWSLLGSLNGGAVAVAEGQGSQMMIRDPRLDELLAAHKQFGGASALQLPAGFLRNATFESPQR